MPIHTKGWVLAQAPAGGVVLARHYRGHPTPRAVAYADRLELSDEKVLNCDISYATRFYR